VEIQGSEQEIRDGMLTLRATEQDSVCTLTLSGELDLANASSVSAELERLEATGAPVMIDLSGLEFIDSTGIAILVSTYRRLESRLQIVPSEALEVRRVISVTGLDSELPFAAPLDGS
jgi:anti-sigma B factor antagonist